MQVRWLLLFGGLLAWWGACAQTSTSLAEHVLWERDFSDFYLSSFDEPATDRQGNLWAISQFRSDTRLVCINPSGEVLVNAELPQASFPGMLTHFSLAVSPNGVIGLLARYSHTVGRRVYPDWAKFAIVHPDGSLGPVKQVAAAGAEYNYLVALSDGQFLALGDQSPMVAIRISSEGDVVWRRTFSEIWVLPSGAALENGASCVVSSAYAKPLLEVIWMDKLGSVRHRERIAARRSAAVSVGDVCTILYDREPASGKGEFYLTSFDSRFERVWTVPVVNSVPLGGVYSVVAVSDGYIVTIQARDDLFVAKYNFSGQLAWSTTANSRSYARVVATLDSGFYLIGAQPKDHYGSHIVRGH